MKISHIQAIIFSGILWFAIGLMLLAKGLNFVILGGEQALALVAVALLVGFFKGRFVLSKTVKRITSRIVSQPNPLAISQLYPLYYYLIMGSMVILGISVRFLPIPIAIRGAVDVAIGSALIQGAVLYFRVATASTSSKK